MVKKMGSTWWLTQVHGTVSEKLERITWGRGTSQGRMWCKPEKVHQRLSLAFQGKIIRTRWSGTRPRARRDRKPDGKVGRTCVNGLLLKVVCPQSRNEWQRLQASTWKRTKALPWLSNFYGCCFWRWHRIWPCTRSTHDKERDFNEALE